MSTAATPAIMVATRFSVGWTLNLGNPAAWLTITGIIAAPAGLAVLRIAAGILAPGDYRGSAAWQSTAV